MSYTKPDGYKLVCKHVVFDMPAGSGEDDVKKEALELFRVHGVKPVIFEDRRTDKGKTKWRVSSIEVNYKAAAKAERQRTADDVRAHENDPGGNKDDDAPSTTNAG